MGGCQVLDKPICQRCGYIGPEGARYCARCGRALIPLRTRLTSKVNRLLNSLSPLHLALMGLAALVPIGFLSNHLLVSIGLYFPLSLILLVLAIGTGGVCLGWVWSTPLSNRSRLTRELLVLVSMGLLLIVIWQLDRAFLSSLANGDRTIVSDIPGVHLEASSGSKRVHSVSSPPPYWLITMGYTLLTAVTSGLLRKALKSRQQGYDGAA
jgi:ribosomal protein L40E